MTRVHEEMNDDGDEKKSTKIWRMYLMLQNNNKQKNKWQSKQKKKRAPKKWSEKEGKCTAIASEIGLNIDIKLHRQFRKKVAHEKPMCPKWRKIMAQYAHLAYFIRTLYLYIFSKNSPTHHDERIEWGNLRE